jgi:TIR domain
LYDRLADRFGAGQVFMDVDTIELGVDFGEAINRAVAACKVLLAVIGPDWLTAADEQGRRRLDNPDDFVRLEIEAALDRDVRVIPILAQGAVMPGRDDLPESLARLARRNALFIRHESFRSDAGRLVTAIERVLAVVPDTGADLVTGWQLVDRRKDQAYRWPDLFERYDRYHVYRGETQREGIVFISLGWAVRPGAWGMDRRYVVSFLSRRAPQTPLAEFLAADDYDETGELIAIIRGRDGGSKMYGPADDRPPAYAGFRIATYRDRVQAKGSWNKLAVVAAETDTDTILNHALIQARRRGDL